VAIGLDRDTTRMRAGAGATLGRCTVGGTGSALASGALGESFGGSRAASASQPPSVAATAASVIAKRAGAVALRGSAIVVLVALVVSAGARAMLVVVLVVVALAPLDPRRGPGHRLGNHGRGLLRSWRRCVGFIDRSHRGHRDRRRRSLGPRPQGDAPDRAEDHQDERGHGGREGEQSAT